MKISQSNISKIKKGLELDARDKMLEQNKKKVIGSYNVLIAKMETLLEDFKEEIQDFNIKEVMKGKRIKKLEKQIMELYTSFSQNELLDTYHKSLLEDYKRAYEFQLRLLDKKVKEQQDYEKKVYNLLKTPDKFGQTIGQRLDKNHIVLGYKAIQEIQDSARKEKDWDTAKKLVLATILSYAAKNAVNELVTQQTIVEQEARDAAVKQDKVYAVWIAVRDSKTCSECSSRNGEVYELSDSFEKPPIHGCCRCMVVYLKKSELEELGY